MDRSTVSATGENRCPCSSRSELFSYIYEMYENCTSLNLSSDERLKYKLVSEDF